MNDIVKSCVEGRKTAIFSAYDVKNQNTLNKIDDLFKRLESFANNYDDVMAFESAFATSDLNKEYMELFTQIATSETPKININQAINVEEAASTTETNSEGNILVDEIVEDATYRARRAVKQETYDKVRDIPVVGDVLNVKQHVDFFSRFRKNKVKYG